MGDSTIELTETLTVSEEITKNTKKKNSETLAIEDLLSKVTTKGLPESLGLEDLLVKEPRNLLVESLVTADTQRKLVTKPLPEPLSTVDSLPRTYEAFPHQTFEIEIYRNGNALSVQKGDVLEFRFRKVLTEEVGGGFVLFNNRDNLDYREGDQIEFKWQSEGSATPTRIFLGEIDKVEKEWDEEEHEQRLRVLFQDWGKLLLEKKITQSFATVTNVNAIIEQVLASIKTENSPPYIQERLINVDSVNEYVRTRTIDFVGESLWDCLKKLAFITQSEFYVDQYKRLKFFQRASSVLRTTLSVDDLLDYRVEQRDDLVCNTCQVYGHQNRPHPIDFDDWTNSTLYWSSTCDPSSPLSACNDPLPFLGNYSVKISVAGTAPPSADDWIDKYWPQYFKQVWPGQGMNICAYSMTPPPGKKIELKGAHVRHSGAGDCKIYYAFGGAPACDSDAGWTYMGNVDNTAAWIEISPIEGLTNQVLWLRFKTPAVPFCVPGCYNEIDFFGLRYRIKPFNAAEEFFTATLTLPEELDIGAEEGFRKLDFHVLTRLANYSYGGSMPIFTVTLHFKGGGEATYQAQFHGIFLTGWTDFSLPIGPDEEGWSSTPSGTITDIGFNFRITSNSWDINDFILIDALHLDRGKWYGVYSDSASMLSPDQGGYGIKYRKIFDDTLYSDVAAGRIARETVWRYKEPLVYLSNVKAVIDDMEFLEPGDLFGIEIPEFGDTLHYYRLLEIEYTYDEETYFGLKLWFERTTGGEFWCSGYEQLENQGFEDGSLSKWVPTGGSSISTEKARTGTYSCKQTGVSQITQTITNLDSDDCGCALFYALRTGSDNKITGRIVYDDASYDEFEFILTDTNTWYLCDLTGEITAGKVITGILIKSTDSDNINYIDDVTLRRNL